MNVENIIVWITVLAVTGLIASLVANAMSPEARERRRCRRNHRKIVSRVRRPAVMLSARSPRG